MLFTEARFFWFFLLAFGVYWALPRNRVRKVWLLGTSYVFYAAWDWRFLGLILFSTLLDWVVGRRLQREERPVARRSWMAVSLAGNLGLLGFFKYYNFFVESAAAFADLLGFEASPHTLRIILPVGISFYTFQTLSYTIDVYRRRLHAVDSALDFALFVGFFPQLVAGPIVRASHFLPQLETKKRLRNVDFKACLGLFLVGFVKKAVLSDNIAPVIDPVFSDPSAFTAGSNWICLFLWHVQIYCDFSGYSDMAIATAGLLGYHLPLNFAFPYFSRNIGEFWQRWHISLSTWFRDYLYISLGGSRGSSVRGVVMGSITMMLCGLWHGAGWQYVGFGILMSSAIVIARVWEVLVAEGSALRRSMWLLGPLLMNWFLFVNWIVFRAVGWDECKAMFRIFFFLDGGGARTLEAAWMLVFAGFAVVHTGFRYGWWERLFGRVSGWTWAAAYGVAAALALVFMATDYQPFIYFQF